MALNNNRFSKNGLMLIVVSMALFLIFIVLAYLALNNVGKPQSPASENNKFSQNYSNINKLTPGKSTYSEVLKKNGKPVSEKVDAYTTTLAFETPNSTFENIAVLKNNILEYAVEYVYSSYRGAYSDYTNKYGAPELHLYSDMGYDWYIFLNEGVGVEASNNEITRIVYFTPQEKSEFINNIATPLNMSEKESKTVEDFPIF